MMRAAFRYLLIPLVCCACFAPQQAQAQFWKHIFGKEEKHPVRKPAPRSTTTTKKTGSQAEKKKEVKPEPPRLAPTVKKARYRIDLLAPLYLGELVSGGKLVYKSHLPDKVLPMLNFYQGVQLAADTLNGQGYHLDVFIHDISDPKESVDALLKANKLDTADLIIGAVNTPQVAPLAALAKKRNINFVSALMPTDANVKTNPYFNLVQPRLQRHCEAIRAAVRKLARPTANILVYHRSSVSVDEQCFRFVTKDSPFAYVRIAANTPMPSDKLRNFLDSNTTNIVVMPIMDGRYATQLLEQLQSAFPRYRFEVYGMPSWKGLAILKKESSESNIGITIPSSYYFDPSGSAGKNFSDSYNARYGGHPQELAYRGYELLCWYAYLLQRYGTVFNEHFADNGVAPFTRFDLRPVVEKDGTTSFYENQHVYLYRFQGGSFNVEQ